MSRCFMISAGSPANEIIVRRTAAIGDALCATIVSNRLAELGYPTAFQTHSDMHCVVRRVPSVDRVELPAGFAHVILDGAYESHPAKRLRHFHDMFYERANHQLRTFGISLGAPFNCRPKMKLHPVERKAASEQFAQYPKPWVFVCPRSDSYAVRQVPDGNWNSAAALIQGTKFWIGRHPAPPNFVDLQCRHFDNVISYLSAADILATVDTGPMHVAAALGIPIVAIKQSSSPEMHLNDQNDFVTISPSLPCLHCMENICPKNNWVPPCQNVSPDLIAGAVNQKLSGKGKVSAVVAIWKPDAKMLTRCLEALLPQVDEIVITAEARSQIPVMPLKDPKIRHVQTWRGNIGYSGNANFGARHTIGEWILFVNDDCFLHPNAVAKMLEAAKPDTGIVSNLLRYPDGTIYHAGKVRVAGQRGWGHIDYKHQHPTFTDVTEIENCCGCCVLTRRSVFYQAGCYDEELPLFAQDDAYALSVRRLKYKILFTPHSEGIHLEHQSVNKVGNVMDLVRAANTAFDRKWRGYLDHNINRVPFGNFAY